MASGPEVSFTQLRHWPLTARSCSPLLSALAWPIALGSFPLNSSEVTHSGLVSVNLQQRPGEVQVHARQPDKSISDPPLASLPPGARHALPDHLSLWVPGL